MLSPIELLGLTPRLRIVGLRTRVIAGEVETYTPQRRKQPRNTEQRRKTDRAYRERNRERVRIQARAGQKRRHLRDPDGYRAYHRKRMSGKQLKANYAPAEWERRKEMQRAARARRDADPIYRAARLAKQRAGWHARKTA